MSAVTFTAVGVAQPKGSTKAFMRKGAQFPTVTSDNPKVKGWEGSIRAAIQQQCAGAHFGEEPVRLSVLFYLPAPKDVAKKIARGARAPHHTKKPDLDKLVRATKDALKGVLWKDDSQVVDLVARKRYTTEQPFARITVDYAELPRESAGEQDLFAPLDEVRV